MKFSSAPKSLEPEEIAKPIADCMVTLALNSQPGEWCHSILFPLGYFECEIIKAVEIIGSIRRSTVPLEIVKIDFNVLNIPPLAAEVRRLLHLIMLPLLEGSGRILKDTPEGLVVLLGEDGQIGNDHESPIFLAPAQKTPRQSGRSRA
jgi:hypothetical protein